MAFSTKHKGLIYQLFGIPRSGGTVSFLGYNLGNPLVNNVTNAHFVDGDHSAIVTKMNTQIAAVEALADNSTENLVKDHLCRYEQIASSTMDLRDKGGASGRVVDDEREVRKIRALVGDLIGWASPLGGYSEEAERLYSRPGAGDR